MRHYWCENVRPRRTATGGAVEKLLQLHEDGGRVLHTECCLNQGRATPNLARKGHNMLRATPRASRRADEEAT